MMKNAKEPGARRNQTQVQRQEVELIHDFWDLSNRKYISSYVVGD